MTTANMSSTEEAFIREKEDMGPRKVSANNKRWEDKVKRRKEELAKKVSSSDAKRVNYGMDYTKKRPVDEGARKAFRAAGFHAGGKD